jgi:cytochrome c
MKTGWKLIVAASGLLLASAANAVGEQELAQKSGCLVCHAVDKRVIGPSYKEVSAKYKGDKGAEAKLIEKIKKGGTGVWGQVPMPPNFTVKDADIKTLTKWILSQ